MANDIKKGKNNGESGQKALVKDSPKPVFTQKDLAVLELAQADPKKSTREIGKEVYGEVSGGSYIYARLKKSEVLRASLDAVRQNNSEYLSRVLTPMALEKHLGILNKEKTTDKDMLTAVKLAYENDEGFSGARVPVAPVINIGQIQAIINQAFVKEGE